MYHLNLNAELEGTNWTMFRCDLICDRWSRPYRLIHKIILGLKRSFDIHVEIIEVIAKHYCQILLSSSMKTSLQLFRNGSKSLDISRIIFY